jgi:hypothetical protein
LSYQSTYNDRAFTTIASKCTGFFDADDAAECVYKIKAIQDASWADDPSLPRTPMTVDAARASPNDLNYVVGFFETLGAAYNDRKLDRGLVDRDFAAPAVWFFIDAWWYICWSRCGQSALATHLYEEFETFVVHVRSRRGDLDSAARPKRQIRLICIPGSSAPSSAWRAAARLSNALSASAESDVGVPESLTHRVEHLVNDLKSRRAAASSTRAQLMKMIAVPSDINIVEDVWRFHRARAVRIQDLISELSVDELDQLARSV